MPSSPFFCSLQPKYPCKDKKKPKKENKFSKYVRSNFTHFCILLAEENKNKKNKKFNVKSFLADAKTKTKKREEISVSVSTFFFVIFFHSFACKTSRNLTHSSVFYNASVFFSFFLHLLDT